MFILKKILNSGTSAPEPTRLPKQNNITVYPGEALHLNSTALSSCGYIDYPDYISLGKFTGDEMVICYPVTEDMVFECEWVGEAQEPRVGDAFDIATDTKNAAMYIGELNSEGPAVILAYDGKTALVKFRRIYAY